MKIYFDLFMTFFKIGSLTFGSGYAMIPVMQHEAEKKGWIDREEMIDLVSVSESTPGPVSLNLATFIGVRKAGVFGAFCATSGIIIPPFMFIFFISRLFSRFSHLKTVVYAFNGIRAGILTLVFTALISMYRQCPKNKFFYAVSAAAFLSAALFGVNVLTVIACCALAGTVYTFSVKNREEK